MREKLSIVIPVYNEAANIKKVLDGISRNCISIPLSIYVVYDIKNDNTIPVIERIKSKYRFPIVLVKNTRGGGVLNAIKAGIGKSKGKAVLITMADMSDDPADIPKMYRLIEKGYDIVVASRNVKGGRHLSQRSLKKFFSWFVGNSMHYITGIPTHDVTNNFKMYRKSILNKMTIESTGGFELAMEITVKAYSNGCKIIEIPTTWRNRTSGKSRFQLFGWAPHYMKWYVYGIIHRPALHV